MDWGRIIERSYVFILFERYGLKEDLRILVINAKVLQFCADIFAVLGIGLFIYLFYDNFNGRPLDAFKDPIFVVTVLIPFVPAAALAAMAAGKRKQIKALLEQNSK